MDRTADVAEILDWLATRHSERNIAGMARYGIDASKAFGVSNAELRPLARRIGRDHRRALALWDTGWREARLLAAFTAEKNKLTPEQARAWAATFNSWEIVDGTTDLFADAQFWPDLVEEFAADEREFVRRAAFATLVWACVHRKKEPDATFLAFLPLIERHAGDPRNFVKKAVNWALRQIGKRSPGLHGPCLELAHELAKSDDPARRWVGAGALRELDGEKVRARLGLPAEPLYRNRTASRAP